MKVSNRLSTQFYLLMFHHEEVNRVLRTCDPSTFNKIANNNEDLQTAFAHLLCGLPIPTVMHELKDRNVKQFLCRLLCEDYEYTGVQATKEAMSFVRDVNKLIAEA